MAAWPRLGFRVWGLGFRVQGLGFRVSGLGFRVWNLGFGEVRPRIRLKVRPRIRLNKGLLMPDRSFVIHALGLVFQSPGHSIGLLFWRITCTLYVQQPLNAGGLVHWYPKP